MRINPARRRHRHREPIGRFDDASAALAEALADLEREGDIRGQESWLIGVRVGLVRKAIPPGVELATCFACGSPTWITGRLRDAMERRGSIVRPICGDDCPGGFEGQT